jgi:hypothetical protein
MTVVTQRTATQDGANQQRAGCRHPRFQSGMFQACSDEDIAGIAIGENTTNLVSGATR